ncbi:hypothetical protein AB1N83_012691, partial [Pleurotus pulmonarius]
TTRRSIGYSTVSLPICDVLLLTASDCHGPHPSTLILHILITLTIGSRRAGLPFAKFCQFCTSLIISPHSSLCSLGAELTPLSPALLTPSRDCHSPDSRLFKLAATARIFLPSSSCSCAS